MTGKYKGEAMAIFTEKETEGFYDLSDMAQVEAGEIRGERKSWLVAGQVRCGRHTTIGGHLNARGKIFLGKYCAIGRFVSIHSGNHRTDLPNQQVLFNNRHGFASVYTRKGPVHVGHNVWIADKVNILSGVTVGHGAVLAAGATVAADVPPFAIVGGVPSKVLKTRFSPMVVRQMLEIAWWNWSDDRIGRNRRFFETSISPEEEKDIRDLVVD